jgi:hypothetical protein
VLKEQSHQLGRDRNWTRRVLGSVFQVPESWVSPSSVQVEPTRGRESVRTSKPQPFLGSDTQLLRANATASPRAESPVELAAETLDLDHHDPVGGVQGDDVRATAGGEDGLPSDAEQVVSGDLLQVVPEEGLDLGPLEAAQIGWSGSRRPGGASQARLLPVARSRAARS